MQMLYIICCKDNLTDVQFIATECSESIAVTQTDIHAKHQDIFAQVQLPARSDKTTYFLWTFSSWVLQF